MYEALIYILMMPVKSLYDMVTVSIAHYLHNYYYATNSNYQCGNDPIIEYHPHPCIASTRMGELITDLP